jgi:hypothetical protein
MSAALDVTMPQNNALPATAAIANVRISAPIFYARLKAPVHDAEPAQFMESISSAVGSEHTR